MKRILFVLGLSLFIFGSAFATDVPVTAVTLRSFEINFRGAKDVSWSESEKFSIARFTLEGKTKYAYFDAAGDLVVVAEPITLNELSDVQKANLYKNFEAYTITDLYKMVNEEGTRYFAVVENKNKQLILSNTSGKWMTEQTKMK
jgi:hypothetical protein